MWIGLLAASSGQWMEQVATGWLVLELTDSPFMVAFAHGARAIPSLIMSPLGGVLADRLDRRKLLAASQFGAAGLAGVMAGLNLTHAIQTWHVFVIALLFGTVWALNNPARHSLIPTLVPRQDLMNAMAVSSSAFNVSRVLGPALAGILIATLDIGGVFSLSAGLYLLVFASLFLIRAGPRVARAQRESLLSSFRGGFQYLKAHREMLSLILLAFIPMTFGMPYVALMPVFVRDIMHRDASSLAVIYMAMGVGALVSTLTLATLGNYRRAGRILLGLGLAFGFGIVAFSFSGNFLLALGVSVLTGGSFQAYMAITTTVVQTNVPDHMRGRVMSILMMEFGLMPLGSLLMGAVAEVLSPRTGVLMMGLIVTAAFVFALAALPTIRRLDPAARLGRPAAGEAMADERLDPQPIAREPLPRPLSEAERGADLPSPLPRREGG